MCSQKDIGELFIGKPDDFVLVYDQIEQHVMQWQPHSVGASIHSIVFTNKRAWMIIKPMAKAMDIKFYTGEPVDHKLIFKVTEYRNSYANHIRLSHPDEVTDECIELLYIGYTFALNR